MRDTRSKPAPAAVPTERGKRTYNVPAAEKALDLIEYAATMPEGLTATELAAGVGRSVHEIYRVIQVLEARGYLYRPPGSDRYKLSLKLFELAHRIPTTRQLADAALPIMQALAPATMQSCHLAVLSGADVLIIMQADPPLPMRYSVSLGARFPFEETSSGLLLYAFSDAATREGLDRAVAARETGAGPVATVRRQAEEIVARGHDLRASLAVDGVTNISVPIFDYLGHVVAALTVAHLKQRAATVPLETVLEHTIDAGRALSRQLGAGSRLSEDENDLPAGGR
ncbi:MULTISPECIES: IclR family transcriptional regulator [unclassified Roseitalea]|uniref:IclR family transcriptional regulator n=1 Tax=unclassified Roseitalea TaxID=2639107 RepID=UPI00273D512F|nr:MULTISPECIES: IclR family transcriptional regulator [unclassified Roseitalea]